MPYDAFISYSHAADGQLAPALQTALHRFAKPWHKRRALHLFRDETSLAASPGLWPAIVAALGASRYFLLLASPEAARSRWVQQEAGWWLEHRGSQTLLIALTDGQIDWDDAAGDFAWAATDALPANLAGAFASGPDWVDVRFARDEAQLSAHDARFQDAVADMAATLHGRPKEDLFGEDVRQHRRTMRLAAGAIVALVLLLLGTMAGGVVGGTTTGPGGGGQPARPGPPVGRPGRR